MSNNKADSTFVLGLMSGTSLDGLDMAVCEFEHHQGKYGYTIHKADTLPYSTEWKQKLSSAPALRAEAYFALNAEFGRFMAEKVLHFLSDSDQNPEFLASHGHTVFHQPQKGFSTQLGCGATLAALTGITTVCDFRSLDVALGGQGAPLVPIGDKLLFPQFQACVNLGGIANLSFDNAAGERLAFDICVVNLLLNHLSEQVGNAYDENGSIASSGKIDPELLCALNELDYYKIEGAKSIGREWLESHVLPLLNSSRSSVEDKLSTSVEHIALMLAHTLTKFQIKEALFTGGGAFNSFLMERIQFHTVTKCKVADPQIVNFKEALIFAFLGYLRIHNRINILSTVTGALTNSIGGAIYSGKM